MTAATEFLRQCAYIIAVIAAETALYIRFRLFVEEAGDLCALYALQLIVDGIQLLTAAAQLRNLRRRNLRADHIAAKQQLCIAQGSAHQL